MIPIDEGRRIVLGRAAGLVSPLFMPSESVGLQQSFGRVLRQVVSADADSPPFSRSVRDGFAVRAADLDVVPRDLAVVGESRAGASSEVTVGPGECCEIMTGAEVPRGADAVVMVEYTERVSPRSVRALRSVRSGQSIQTRGSECLEGARILEEGRTIGASEVGVLASSGHAEVMVSRRPRVAIVSTGDELVEIAEVPGPAQIRNSNSATLAAQVADAGGEPSLLGIARDVREDLRARLEAGLEYDLLISSGGVSMGKYDLVIDELTSLGVEIGFDRVAMKPGKPTVFGWRDRTFVFGLPGNPVSTIVSFQLFVRPLIRSLLHAAGEAEPRLDALLEGDARCDPERAACVPATVRYEDGAYRLSLVGWKGSSDLVGLARANAYAMIPKRDGTLGAGSRVRFIPMSTGN